MISSKVQKSKKQNLNSYQDKGQHPINGFRQWQTVLKPAFRQRF